MSIVVSATNEPASGGAASQASSSKVKPGGSYAGSAQTISPRRAYGYSFNNGNAKQPVLRAQEYDAQPEHGVQRSVVPGSVGLNFNYWMEHNYIVDRDVTELILTTLHHSPRSARFQPHHIVKHDLSQVKNVLVLSIQGLDPRELNDSIETLPFLTSMSCMPIRHIHEESSPLVSLDEPLTALGNADQQWQYLEVCNQNAKLLWCDKPSLPLSAVAHHSTAELLTRYTLTFLGVHTQWQDDIIMYSDLNGNNAATVGAFQEQARQKLIGCKDAPAYMLQLMCDLTKPPQPGDIFGRCTRVKAKETGMYLYRPASPLKDTINTAATASGRLIIIWQRIKEIDILEEVPSATSAHNKTVIPNSAENTDVLTLVKVQPTTVAGARNRFQEVLDLVLTLSKAVCRITPTVTQPTGAGGPEISTTSSNGENVLPDHAIQCAAETTAGVMVPIVPTGEGDSSVHQYFSADLQDSLRQEFQSNAMKCTLERLVLSPAMQDIMGYVTSRSNGYEDFLDSSDRYFHRSMSPAPLHTGNENSNSKELVGKKRPAELEDGEEAEDEVEAPVVSCPTARPNKKIYFNASDSDRNSGEESTSESETGDVTMAALMAGNARKRKAQEAELEAEEAEEGEKLEDNSMSSLDRMLAAKRAKLGLPPSVPAAVPPPPPPRPPPPTSAPPSSSKKIPTKLTLREDDAPEVVKTVTSKSSEQPLAVASILASPSVVVCRSAPALKIESVVLPPKPAPKHDVPAVAVSTAEGTTVPLLAPHIVTPLKVCALDCEMCSTAAGLELTRLTVLCPIHGVVYDALVRPELEILDYHTEFSGITKESMQKVTTTFAQVQEVLRCLISQDTIIVGHSADTDLKVLKLVHGRVIDTAALYPHPSGLPYKHALKRLAKDYLHKDIQDGSDGHDSVQDAAIALELAFLKAQRGDAVGVAAPWNEDPVPKCSVLEGLVRQLLGTGSGQQACTLDVHVHGVPSELGYDVPAWEEHAFGYRPEGDSCLNVEMCRAALQAELDQLEQAGGNVNDGSARTNTLQRQVQQIFSTRHSSSEEAVAHAIQDLQALDSHNTSSDTIAAADIQRKGLVYMELTCPAHSEACCDGPSQAHSDSEDHYGPQDAEGGGNSPMECDGYIRDGSDYDHHSRDETSESGLTGWRNGARKQTTPLAQLDRMVQQLYQTAPQGTLLLVVTQGSMQTMKLLASRKIRNRWEQAQIKRKQSQVGAVRVPWDAQVDEGRLIAAAAHATAGAVFVGIKE